MRVAAAAAPKQHVSVSSSAIILGSGYVGRANADFLRQHENGVRGVVPASSGAASGLPENITKLFSTCCVLKELISSATVGNQKTCFGSGHGDTFSPLAQPSDEAIN